MAEVGKREVRVLSLIHILGSLFPALLDQLIESRHAMNSFLKICGMTPYIFHGTKDFIPVSYTHLHSV